MKPDKRREERRLRQEEGLAITEICKLLGVAKSSVSLWVRDIELTDMQKARLHEQHYAYLAQLNGSHTNAVRAKAAREQFQQEGRLKAREQDPLHIAGCMLYWGEGAKSRNYIELANSDADLLAFFIRFLRESLYVSEQDIRIRVSCYLGNGFTEAEIENYWLEQLNLAPSALEKTIINVQPRPSSQGRGRKLSRGTCNIRIYQTRLVQHIYGAIQEYTGIDKPEWLM